MCHYGRAVPVASLLPSTFANFHQLVNPERRRRLIPEPEQQPSVYGLRLSVPRWLGSLLLTALGCLVTQREPLGWAGPSRRAKRRDGDASGAGWRARPEHLQVHVCERLSIRPSPICTAEKAPTRNRPQESVKCPGERTNLWASNGPGDPAPAASAHCAACSPSHSLSSRWSPPAVGTLSCKSTISLTRRPNETAPLHLKGSEREEISTWKIKPTVLAKSTKNGQNWDLKFTLAVEHIGVAQDGDWRYLVEGGFRFYCPTLSNKGEKSVNAALHKYKRQLNKDRSKPYLTLFHADISLAFSLSISSGSPLTSLPGSMLCGSLGPWDSRGFCLWFSTSSSCMTPAMYCAALGEMEFIPLRPQSGTLQLIVATEKLEKEAGDPLVAENNVHLRWLQAGVFRP